MQAPGIGEAFEPLKCEVAISWNLFEDWKVRIYLRLKCIMNSPADLIAVHRTLQAEYDEQKKSRAMLSAPTKGGFDGEL
jgi:hypothetical protein